MTGKEIPKQVRNDKLERDFRVKTRVHLFISGTVQGVFFRDSAKQVAQSMGITGYARNLQDGRVEIVAEGEKEGEEEKD